MKNDNEEKNDQQDEREEWDDMAIIRAFEAAFSDQQQSKAKSTLTDQKGDCILQEDIKFDIHNAEEVNQGSHPQPTPHIGTTESKNKHINFSDTCGFQNPSSMPSMSLPQVPLHANDEGFQNVLLAWYQAGYYTGRYQAMQEMKAKSNI